MFRRGNFRSTFYNESKKQQQKSSKVKNLRDISGREGSSASPRDLQTPKSQKWGQGQYIFQI